MSRLAASHASLQALRGPMAAAVESSAETGGHPRRPTGAGVQRARWQAAGDTGIERRASFPGLCTLRNSRPERSGFRDGWVKPDHDARLFPSPLAGEGGSAKPRRMRGRCELTVWPERDASRTGHSAPSSGAARHLLPHQSRLLPTLTLWLPISGKPEMGGRREDLTRHSSSRTAPENPRRRAN